MSSYNRKILERTSLLSLTATLVMTTVHHAFRLGAEFILYGMLAIVVSMALMAWYQRTSRRAALIAYGVYTALVVFWFGIIDGFMDHVLKALGLQNTTLLPGSEEAVVATTYALWSPEATYLFYEGSGFLTFVFSAAAAIYTFGLVWQTLSDGSGIRRQTATVG